MAGIETNDIFSEDTQRMLEGFNLGILSLERIQQLLADLKDAVDEVRDAITENRSVLVEIKEELEGD